MFPYVTNMLCLAPSGQLPTCIDSLVVSAFTSCYDAHILAQMKVQAFWDVNCVVGHVIS
jgi:hypothetical protein